jgi:hypothetical protein
MLTGYWTLVLLLLGCGGADYVLAAIVSKLQWKSQRLGKCCGFFLKLFSAFAVSIQ